VGPVAPASEGAIYTSTRVGMLLKHDFFLSKSLNTSPKARAIIIILYNITKKSLYALVTIIVIKK